MISLLKSILISTLILFCISTVSAQTTIHGKLLSVDGSIIPKTIISIHEQYPRDIFSGYEDLYVDADGSYRITILEPGLYNITFRAIFHRNVNIPILIIDQESIEMDLLLIPGVYNDGRYFENDEYLEWIRVIGNFNNYDFLTGIPFSLNDDGSISAFIPVTSDTIRHQVRGLGYGRLEATPLPPFDEYNIRRNRSFESVLYRNLPSDSLEIRYTPGESIPYQRLLPFNADQDWLNPGFFINFKNSSDRYWLVPIHLIRYFRTILPIIERDLTNGLTSAEQLEYMEKYFSEESTDHLREIKQQISNFFYQPNIHPQQKAILSLGYAGVLYRIEMLNHMLRQTPLSMRDMLDIGKSNENESESNLFDDLTIDKEILLQIPQLVAPTHPILSQAQTLPQYLLNITGSHTDIIDYYMEIVKNHSSEWAIHWVLSALIREQASDYKSVDQMEVYQIIVERFGEGELARRSHELFRQVHHQEW